MKTNNNTRKLVMTALFMALVCTATMVIRIPTPGTNGYIHPGDALVILSGIFLGPVQGLLAAGIGSALADFLGGYLLYVPATFLIKADRFLLRHCISETFSDGRKTDRRCGDRRAD